MAESTRFPMKVHLHIHLDSAMRAETVLELGKKKLLLPKSLSLVEFKKQFVGKNTAILGQILPKPCDIIMKVFAGDQDAIYRMAYEFCEDCSKQGIKYTEVRFSPHTLANTFPKPLYAQTSGNLSPRDVVVTVIEALGKGSEHFDIIVKVILCCLRPHPEWSLEVVQLCKDYRDVIGIDVMWTEYNSGLDPSCCPHALAFKDAEVAGLQRTAHALSDQLIEESLDVYHVQRIGHGYDCIKSKSLYERILREKIHLETCPSTTNTLHSAADHPLLTFAKDQANFSINCVSPLYINKNLEEQFTLAKQFQLTDDDLKLTIFNAARSSFATIKERKTLLDHLVVVYGDRYLQPSLERTETLQPTIVIS